MTFFKCAYVATMFLLCLAKPIEVIGMQDSTLSVWGSVTDSASNALAGVTVKVKGGTLSTSTDLHGKYFIEVPDNAVLQYSLVGYGANELRVTESGEMNIILSPGTEELDEVVVVGFGVQKKISSVGAQNTVKPQDLKLPVRNLNTSLLGRLAGITGVQRGGEPGNDNAEIFIRGIATLDRGLSQPLVLVDGVERQMNDLDPEDIESFTILKDASATAVYGVRGANGVVLITTKKGVPGKAKIKVRYSEGLSTFTTLPELSDAVTYMLLANEASITRGGNQRYAADVIDKTATGEDPYLYPNVDWVDQIFNKWTTNRNANVNIAGGNHFATYYVSTGYFRDNGVLKTDEMAQYNSNLYLNRYNFTSNVQLNVTNSTILDLGIQGNIINRNLPGEHAASSIFGQAMQIPPNYHAVRYPNGRLAGGLTTVILNPYNSLTQRGYRTQWNSQLFSNLRLTQKLDFWVPGLSVTGMFSFDTFNRNTNNRTKNPDTWFATGRNDAGELTFDQTYFSQNQYLGFSATSSGSRQFYTEAAVNYSHSFGRHDLGAMILYNQRDYITTGGNLISSLPQRARGIAGRTHYAYLNKYLAELNFGYNGSENFAPDKRYGFFPSLGLGWVLSEEAFFRPISSVLQFFKLRFTHGLAGNSTIGGRRFAYIGTVDQVPGYAFGLGDVQNVYSGLELGEYPVDVTWETSTKTNLGVEVRSLNNALNIQVDLFRENRDGIFLRRTSLPDYLGILNEPYGNLGVVLNKGIDASFTYNHEINDLSLQFQGNFTFARNKIIENDEPARRYPWMNRKGQRVGQPFGYVALGLFRDSTEIQSSPAQTGDVRPGDIKFKDLNGDDIIDQYDMQSIGFGPFPEIVYGFGLTATYKRLNIGVFFQGAGNVNVIMDGEGFVPFLAGSERGNLFDVASDRWTPENPNPNAFYPRLSFGSLNDNYTSNTWFMRDVSYLRLKALQASYELPSSWFKSINIRQSRLFFIGTNVFTFSKFRLWDVELGSGRGNRYPNMSTYSFGFEVSF